MNDKTIFLKIFMDLIVHAAFSYALLNPLYLYILD